MSRIAECAPDVARMRARADSELNLLRFYDNVALPDVVRVCATNFNVHSQSVELLRDYSPWLLDNFIPVDVAGDGNCLFRAVSLALCGTETHHVQLHLLATIEALLHRDVYDNTSVNYYEPYKVDDRLVLSDYSTFVTDIVVNGKYSDMHTVLAISAVVQKPIQTRWPIRPSDAWDVPLTKLVTGRDVQTSNPVKIWWTIGAQHYSGKNTRLTLNNFVPLLHDTAVSDACLQEKTCDKDDSGAEKNAVAPEDDAVELPPASEGVMKLTNRFLSLAECLELLQNDDIPTLPQCPCGMKEDVCYKVTRFLLCSI